MKKLFTGLLALLLLAGCDLSDPNIAQEATRADAQTEALQSAPLDSADFLLERHWLLWKPLDPQPSENIGIGTKGLFDLGGGRSQVVRNLVRLLNPADKLHNDREFRAPDPNEHLNAYRSFTREPLRIVEFENQFGPQAWILGRGVAILTPAQKEPHPFPDTLDHYKCYRALEADRVEAPIGVRDQFTQQFFGGEYVPTVVHRGRLFCVPIMKRHAGVIFPILHPRSFLAIYDIDRIEIPILERVVHDQFRTGRLLLFERATHLAVESDLLFWDVIAGGAPDGDDGGDAGGPGDLD